MNLEKDLTAICSAAGLDGPVMCPYDWRQTVEFIAEAWVVPRIWQHVGDKKKVLRAYLLYMTVEPTALAAALVQRLALVLVHECTSYAVASCV